MFNLSEWLVERFVPDHEKVEDGDVRARYGFLEAWVSIIGNILLAALKVFLGISLNSIALLADAVHTASDVLTSVVVLVGFRAARMPADKEHPFGHGRVEPIATLIIAILLAVVGLQFASTSARRFFGTEAVDGSILIAGVLAATGIAKEWMARFSVALGRKINSGVLVADAWHHRSDAVATMLVAVAIVATSLGYPRFDAVFGLIVSALVIYTAYDIGMSAASTLIGERPSPELVDRIGAIVRNVKGVKSMHKISVHDYGSGRKVISLHIQVDGALPVTESHEIAERVEDAISSQINAITTVHVEPPEPPAREGL
ncbi:MAG TPA: cation transporter [Firmicutes bacterium]|nr:cation transporter [Bacillota bacterium]